MVSLPAALLTLVLSGTPAGDTVLLDFYADWCGPCQQMNPVVEQLAGAGFPVKRVNFDRNRQLASRYGVDRLPTFLMLVNGRVVDREIGMTSYGRLEKMCRLAQGSRPVGSTQPAVAIVSPQAPDVVIPAVASEPAFSAGQTPPVIPASLSATDTAATSGWKLSSQSLGPTGAKTGLSDAELIAATVRLRIEDADGQSCGSGTIIDARQGEALILTCGHIFRDSKGKGRIQVDLFGPTPQEGIPGRLISFDLDRDVALLSIRTSGPLVAAHVAPPNYRVAKNDRVINVGCNNGAQPTVRHSSVTALDKFMGPTNYTVAGLPVQGRSGGGLFSTEGMVIGVCNAADPSDNEGLYAALESVHAELDRAELTSIYDSHNKGPADKESLVAVSPPPMPKQMPDAPDVVQLTQAPLRAEKTPASELPHVETPQKLSGEERDALEEIRRRRAEGSEVIFVIRSSDPHARSEIICLENASNDFLKQLAEEAKRLGDSGSAASSQSRTDAVPTNAVLPATSMSSSSPTDSVPSPRSSQAAAAPNRFLEWSGPDQESGIRR
jgi:thiol-disulfide isomerase/thioredoxin